MMGCMMGQRGFSLVEVLVTMVVIGVGLLAAAGLQAMTKKINYDAVQRSGATQYAQAMVERLRGNPGELAGYVTADVEAVAAGVDCGAAAAACSATELVAYDLGQWARSINGLDETIDSEAAGGLVSPTGCISATATPNLYTVTVAWRGVTGLDPVSGPGRNACGEGLGRYDDAAEAPGNERMRRFVALEAFVSDPYAGP